MGPAGVGLSNWEPRTSFKNNDFGQFSSQLKALYLTTEDTPTPFSSSFQLWGRGAYQTGEGAPVWIVKFSKVLQSWGELPQMWEAEKLGILEPNSKLHSENNIE
jgi:hypothetical protein